MKGAYAALWLTGALMSPMTANAQTHDMPDMDMSQMDMGPPKSGWHIMHHTALTFVADHQEGPRGGDKAFAAGMVMIMANHTLSDTTSIDLNLMLSPDPFMGKGGYPLLLQTGETADGVHHLTDAQHPHDLFMGMTAKLTRRLDDTSAAFVIAGWPGDAGFGPTPFMHRASGQNFPTAPISHHWFDSGHITMGVITVGLIKGPLTLEISRFTGREPDQHRFNLDTPRLDSTAIRVKYDLTPNLSAQASWARQISPEQLEPGINLIRQSMSFDYRRDIGTATLNSTLAFGRKQAEHDHHNKPSDAYLFENTLHLNGKWMLLGRYERVWNDELGPQAAWVAKREFGVIRTFAIGHDTTIGIGAVRQFNTVPDSLKAAYGNHPNGTVGFIQLKIHPGMMGM